MGAEKRMSRNVVQGAGRFQNPAALSKQGFSLPDCAYRGKVRQEGFED